MKRLFKPKDQFSIRLSKVSISALSGLISSFKTLVTTSQSIPKYWWMSLFLIPAMSLQSISG